MALRLSHKINRAHDIRVLAIHGLGLREDVVNTHLYNERDIRDVVYKVLKEWRNAQPNSRIAYSELCTALRRVGMASYIETGDNIAVRGHFLSNTENVKSVFNLLPALSKHSRMLGMLCVGACIGVCAYKFSHVFLKVHKE